MYLAAAALLAGHPVARTVVSDALLCLEAVAVCAVIMRRRDSWDGVQRLFWDAFAVSMALWIIGELGFMYGELVEGRASCCLLYTSPSPRDSTSSRMPSSA